MSEKNTAFSPQALAQQLPANKQQGRYLVAFSGGLDSLCLLDALVKTRPACQVVALHVHHGLSPYADDWSRHCAAVGAQYGIEVVLERVRVVPAGKGIEDAAREARYAAFARHLQPGDHLLLGHHADDQAETLLLRLLRGTGAKGLEGMRVQRPFAGGTLWRPLLMFSRRMLEDYAREQQLRWVEDDSNADHRYDRNFLRNAIFPLLAERWPDFVLRWQQTAGQVAETNALADREIARCFASLEMQAGRSGWSMDKNRLAEYSPAEQKALLRHGFEQIGLALPGSQVLTTILQQLQPKSADHNFELRWADVVLKEYRHHFYAFSLDDWQALTAPLPEASAPLVLQSPGGTQLKVFAGMQLEFIYCEEVIGPGFLADHFAGLRVKTREGGERSHPWFRDHSRLLKKLLQEQLLEPWWRDRVPLIYSPAGELLAVGDLWVEKCAMALPGQPGWQIRWYRPG